MYVDIETQGIQIPAVRKAKTTCTNNLTYIWQQNQTLECKRIFSVCLHKHVVKEESTGLPIHYTEENDKILQTELCTTTCLISIKTQK